jgi:hypothetical protein
VVLPAVRHGTRPAGVVPAGTDGEGRDGMRADAGTLEEVLGPLRGLLAELKAARKATGKFVDPGAWAEKDFVPTPVLQLLERLTYLLGLSDLEREFFTAGAAREAPDAWDGLGAYADWLEDRGNEARVRKVTPQPGDVLVWSLAAVAGTDRDALDVHLAAARLLHDRLAGRGVETFYVLLHQGVALDRLSAQQMAELGLVPAARLARVRERCAALAEQSHYYRLAAGIRADPSLEEMQWAEVPAPGDNAP